MVFDDIFLSEQNFQPCRSNREVSPKIEVAAFSILLQGEPQPLFWSYKASTILSLFTLTFSNLVSANENRYKLGQENVYRF